MKRLFLIFLFTCLSASVFADVFVNGYTRSDGTYVAPHYRTSPNNTIRDNYSTKGNVNPYTGKNGTVNPYRIETNEEYLKKSRKRILRY